MTIWLYKKKICSCDNANAEFSRKKIVVVLIVCGVRCGVYLYDFKCRSHLGDAICKQYMHSTEIKSEYVTAVKKHISERK